MQSLKNYTPFVPYYTSISQKSQVLNKDVGVINLSEKCTTILNCSLYIF